MPENEKRKVVITGLGLATSLGLHLHGNWKSALDGISGIRPLNLPGSGRLPVKTAGWIRDHDREKIRNDFMETYRKGCEDRTLFALWAAREAIRDAGLSHGAFVSEKAGVILAAGLGIIRPEDLARWTTDDGRLDTKKFLLDFWRSSRDSMVMNRSNLPSALIAEMFGLAGINSTITTACASASQAIGIGYRTIQRGDADIILAGGADSMINPMGIIGFLLLGAIATEKTNPSGQCTPFDRKRGGLVMGEGAGMVVLEEESHAIKRKAPIYAELAGYGSSMDAYRVTAPHPRGDGAATAMSKALADAGISPEEIDYINAHGTGTKLNDSAETLAVKKVFGEHASNLCISSSKSIIGHLIAASGAPEFIFTVMSVKNDEIHPTINLKDPDPKCDLDYVPGKKRNRTVRAAISNSFGFGGQNASLVIIKSRCRSQV
jgi:3-oxoacyl-[acyl-carrier-protein] synthase II